MRLTLRRAIVIGTVLCAAAPPEAAATTAGDGEVEVVAHSDDAVIAMNAQRRRRKRPTRRGGKYQVVAVSGGGTIEGVVVYHGPAPEAEEIQIVKDHKTCGQRSTKRDRMRLSESGRVADAVVFLGDIRSGKATAPPQVKPVIEQRHCTFEPHVQVLLTKQPFEVVNSDPVAHNARCVQNMMTLFNPMQPKQGLRNEFTIRRPGLATITCAVHNWMKAYAYVLWHPYYAVTGADGRFVIGDVPAGEYELVVWQEYVGERSEKVKVEAGKSTSVEFEIVKR